jgi:chromatin segregation and condensation protein Rec8/ScpA/Scc1 (kleisin family)
MTKIEFKATLQMLIPMIIQTKMEKMDIPVIDAIKLLYLSHLYEKLEIESTKLWHLSPLALYELLELELQTGNLVFPTEA